MVEQIKNDASLSLYTGLEINGDSVIGFISPKYLGSINGYLDRPSVLESLFNKYDQKSHVTNLGMVELMKTVNKVNMPMLADMLKTNSVINYKDGGYVTYDLPIPQDPQDAAKVTVDTATSEPIYAGTPFRVILDRAFTAGDLLKPNPAGEHQVEVSRDHPVEPYGGGSYVHYVVYQASNNSRKTFPKQFLREGNPWMRIGHKNGEYGTQFGNIAGQNVAPGHMTIKWTPSSPTTIETAVTRNAALMATNGAHRLSQYTVEKLNDQLYTMGGFESRGLMISAKTVKGQDGRASIDLSTAKIDQTLEYLAMVELHKMQSWTDMFATAYTEHGTEGVIKVNDGLWRQLRRGKIIEYSRPGGITLADLAEAANYYFKNSDIPDEQRIITFKGGKLAVDNGKRLINNHAIDLLSRVPIQLLGSDTLLNGSNQKLVQGDLNNMTLTSNPSFAKAYLPGVGLADFVHDPSFDWNIGSNSARISGFEAQGYGRNTYTLIVDSFDAKSGSVMDKVKGGNLVENGKENSPIYLVRPEGRPYITWGRTQGRMNNGAVFTNVQSSLKYMGQEFWAIMESDVLLLDTTRCTVIELKDTYIYE